MFAMHVLDPSSHTLAMSENAHLVLQAECAACNVISIERSWPPIVTAGDCGDLKEHWSDCRGQDTLVIVERAIL